jgi:hypothetical protein
MGWRHASSRTDRGSARLRCSPSFNSVCSHVESLVAMVACPAPGYQKGPSTILQASARGSTPRSTSGRHSSGQSMFHRALSPWVDQVTRQEARRVGEVERVGARHRQPGVERPRIEEQRGAESTSTPMGKPDKADRSIVDARFRVRWRSSSSQGIGVARRRGARGWRRRAGTGSPGRDR